MGMDVWVNVFPMPFLCLDSVRYNDIIMCESPGDIGLLATEFQKTKHRKRKKKKKKNPTPKKNNRKRNKKSKKSIETPHWKKSI